MWAAAFSIKYQLHHMPGRPCAASVLELNSLKLGRERPHQTMIRLSGSSYSLVPAVSFLYVEVNAPTIPCCNNPSERKHLLVPSTTHGGKTLGQTEEERVWKVETGVLEEARGQLRDHLTGKSTCCLFITHTPFSPTKLNYSKNTSVFYCFATHD